MHQKELEMKKAEGWSERHAQACEGQRAVVWMGAVVYSHQTLCLLLSAHHSPDSWQLVALSVVLALGH